MAKHYVCVDVYTVKAGDTLYSIAEAYGIPVSLLMRVNKICNPYNLKIGHRLCIPGSAGNMPTEPGEGPLPFPTPTLPTPVPNLPTPDSIVPECKGTLHTVKAGDTLYMIAKQYRVNLSAIMDANPTVDPYNLRIGMKLCIPR